MSFWLEGHTKSVNCALIAPNRNYLFTGSRDKTIRVWNLYEKGKVHDVLKKHNNAVTCLAMMKRGTYLLSGSSDKSICIWAITYSKKGSKILKIKLERCLSNAHDEAITCILSSQNHENLFITGANDHII